MSNPHKTHQDQPHTDGGKKRPTWPQVDGTKLSTLDIQYAAYRLGSTVLAPITHPDVPAQAEAAAFTGDQNWQQFRTYHPDYQPPEDLDAAIVGYLAAKGRGQA